jgi:hypothetical protein
MKTIIILLLFISPCLAMDRIGPTFQMTPQSPKEYYGQTNDKVYVSGAKQESRYYIEPKKEKHVCLPKANVDPITVTTTWEKKE